MLALPEERREVLGGSLGVSGAGVGDARALFGYVEEGHEYIMSHPEHFILLVEIPQAASAPESNAS